MQNACPDRYGCASQLSLNPYNIYYIFFFDWLLQSLLDLGLP